jgi:hypothetical protein
VGYRELFPTSFFQVQISNFPITNYQLLTTSVSISLFV